MANKPGIKPELLERRDASKIFESDGLLDELRNALAERALDAEMDAHLDQDAAQAAGNNRNGHSRETVLSDIGVLPLSIPRDRHCRFEPQLIAKYHRRIPGFDDKIVALYAPVLMALETRLSCPAGHDPRF